MKNKQICDILKDLRVTKFDKKLSKERVAEACEVNPSTYMRWEKGDSTNPFEAVLKLSVIYDISLDYFAVTQGRKVSSNKKNDKSLSIRELISLNLKRLRLERGLTQTKIAQNIGISNVAYGQYESKKREPSADMREKISEALNIDELDLIRRPSNEIKSSDDLSKFRDLRKAFFLFQSALGSFDPSLTDEKYTNIPSDILEKLEDADEDLLASVRQLISSAH